jgi:hypothetical protein
MKTLVLLSAVLAFTGCEGRYGFRDVPVGEEPSEPLAVKSNGQIVRALFADVLARAPAEVTLAVETEGAPVDVALDEEAVLVGMLDGVGDTFAARRILTTALLDADAITLPDKEDVDPAQFVEDAFLDHLGRPATPYERDQLVDAWNTDDTVGPRTILRAIMMSRAYQGL